jgi:hypothetical protein
MDIFLWPPDYTPHLRSFSGTCFVFAVCRIATVVAMLLHSLFGCAVHHAMACGSHSHDACEHGEFGVDHPDLHAHYGACHHHVNENCDEDGRHSDVVDAKLTAYCAACQAGPCDGSSPRCHSTLACSFVASSDFVVQADAVCTGFVCYELDSSLFCACVSQWRHCVPRSTSLASGSLSHCATFCTWLI